MITPSKIAADDKQTIQSDYQHQKSGRDYGLEIAMTDTKHKSKHGFSGRVFAILTCSMAMGLLMTGCGLGNGSSSSTSVALPAGSLHVLSGNVHGGQQPVAGSAIQLYAVGTGSYGAAAIPLIPAADQVVYSSTAPAGTTGALTDGNGDFLITGDYSCTKSATGATISDAQVYLVATGGNSNSGTGSTANSAISLMLPLGDCQTLVTNAATTFVQVNELTTAASVFALSPFMTDYAHVGAPTANSIGLINAVGNAYNLVNPSTGQPGGSSLPSGAVVPTALINTLGDIIASCINTSGASVSSACSSLETATGANDTIDMLLAFAKNPTSATLLALTSLASPQSPFQPTSTPTDYTVAIKYNAGGSLLAPYNVAIDAAGDAWVTNTSGSSVVEFTPAGAVGSTLTGPLAGPKGIAIDKSGNVWVANPTANTVVKFAGGAGSGTSYATGTGPVSLAIDSAGTAWVANQVSNSISSVSSTGTVATFSTGFGLSVPSGVAIDTGGNVYVANSGGGNVVKLLNPSGAAATGSPFSDFALQGTIGVALDSSNNVYALGSTTGSVSSSAVSQFSSTGSAASYSPYSTLATGVYPGIVATGTNKVLLTNNVSSGYLQALTLGSTTTSTTYGSLNAPVGLAVDSSGDVWVANSGDNTVSVFVGLVSPVTTPLAANVGP